MKPDLTKTPHGALHLRNIFKYLNVLIEEAHLQKDIWLCSGLLSYAAILAKANGVDRALFVDFAGRLYDTTSELFNATDKEDR